ncbi:MAG: hypothetical protein Q4D93_00610 [Porphyromonas sp.]|nr:hypothetical protein [Porphyromonas sp.]
MDSKIQALADKIYKDGVEKASGEASQIISEAEQKGDQLLQKAKQEADAIIKDAKEESAQLKARSEKEIAAAVEHAMASLQAKITDMVTTEAVQRGVDESLTSPEALYAVVAKMSEQMFEQETNGVEISTSDAEQLTSYFQKHAKEVLDKGLEIKEVAGRPTQFELAPKDGSYKVVVSDEAFKAFFQDFLSPRLKSLLFSEAPAKEA